jgi:hypothetical protein
MTSIKIGQLFTLAYTKPLSITSAAVTRLPGAQMYFYVNGFGAYITQQTVYADSGLTTPLTQPITADANGRFVPVYMNPALQYSWQLYSAGGTLLEQVSTLNYQNTAISVQITKPVSTIVNNNATLFADPDLTYVIPAAGTYRVELDLSLSAGVAGATPGIQFELEFSGVLNSSAGNTLAMVGAVDNAVVSNAQSAIQINVPVTSVSLSTPPYQNTLRIAGTIQVVFPGTLALYWAQAVSNAAGTSVVASSAMCVTRIG